MKLAVIVIHGMGSQSPAFAEPLKAELSKRIADGGKDPAGIAWLPVYWADLLEPAQTKYLAAAVVSNDLDWMELRKFIVKALGDASGYQFVDGASSTYVEIHNRIRGSIHDLYVKDVNSRNRRPRAGRCRCGNVPRREHAHRDEGGAAGAPARDRCTARSWHRPTQ